MYKNIFLLLAFSCILILKSQETYNNFTENELREFQALLQLDKQEDQFEQDKEQHETKNVLLEKDDTQFNEKIFGHEFIFQTSKTQADYLNLPLSNQYQVGINDKVEIIFTGSRNERFSSSVNLDGSISIPNIGKLQVLGENVISLKSKLDSFVKSVYVGVDVDLSITNLGAKKISLIGAVKEPGTYFVNPYATISSALSLSGGLYDSSSLRTVKLIRPGLGEHEFDFYEFLIQGERSKDLLLQSGDMILIPTSKNFIEILGEVNRPMIYEYKKGDNYGSLIKFSLGFTNFSNKEDLYVNFNANQEIKTTKVKLDEAIGDKSLKDLTIFKLNEKYKKDILVDGEGVNGGYFSKKLHKDLGSVVSNLTFSDDVYPFFSTLIQSDANGQILETVFFSLDDPESYKNVLLKNNVEIMFFSKKNIIDLQEYLEFENATEDTLEIIEFSEEVEYLASLPRLYFKNSLFGRDSYILPLAGVIQPRKLFNFFGFSYQLDTEATSVSMIDGLKQNSYEIDIDSKFILQINFPDSKPTYFNVSIEGEVASPGIYAVNGNLSIDDLYSISGGVLPNADVNSIIITKQSIVKREEEMLNKAKTLIVDSLISQLSNPNNGSSSSTGSILPLINLIGDIEFTGRLNGQIAPGSTNAKNTFLESGDKIYVPSKSSSIGVFGEVLNPGVTVYYEGYSALDYIKLSGNLTEYADKSKIYIKESNGQTKLIRFNQLSKTELAPGESIIVSRDLQKLNAFPLIQASVKIISDIAFAAASLNVLRN